jgi:hypothetical protein
MATQGISVSQYAKELGYAAGTGASRLAASLTASASVEAKTGIAVGVPGAALRSVLAQHRKRAGTSAGGVNSNQVPRIADRMADRALDEGASMLSGGKE